VFKASASRHGFPDIDRVGFRKEGHVKHSQRRAVSANEWLVLVGMHLWSKGQRQAYQVWIVHLHDPRRVRGAEIESLDQREVREDALLTVKLRPQRAPFKVHSAPDPYCKRGIPIATHLDADS
jgi:hypothetical protein